MPATANDKKYTYTLTIPYNVSATGCSVRKLTARIDSDGGSLYFASGKALSTSKGNQKITLTMTSTVCLSGKSSVKLYMALASSATKPYDYFKVNGNITLQCSVTRETGTGWHTATVKYYL